MLNEKRFHFLTQEYQLKLVTSAEEIEALKEVRRATLVQRYQQVSPIQNEEEILFNDDDKQSFIYLLQHKKSQQYVGAVRLFFINSLTPLQRLPMESYGVNAIDDYTQEKPIAEISRGALIKELPSHPDFSGLEIRTMLTFNLMVATRLNMLLYPYKQLFCIMEPALHRILSRQNARLEQIGKPVEYYGLRTPYALSKEVLLKATHQSMDRLTKYYLNTLRSPTNPFYAFVKAHPYLKIEEIQSVERILNEYDTTHYTTEAHKKGSRPLPTQYQTLN